MASFCSDNIIEKTCKIDYFQEQNLTYIDDISELDVVNHFRRVQNPECADDSHIYGKILKDLYEKLPNHSKSAFCVIKKIIVAPKETDFRGRATRFVDIDAGNYSMVFDRDFNYVVLKANVLGYVLNLNIDLFLTEETEEEAQTLKFGIPFFKDLVTLEKSNDLPRVVISGPSYKYSSLKKTVIHEIGHFLDFSNGVTSGISVSGNFPQLVNYIYPDKDYPMVLDGDNHHFFKDNWFYGLLDRRVKSRYIEKDGEYYANYGFSPAVVDDLTIEFRPYTYSRLPELFNLLQESNYVSFYSLRSPQEDFAETYLHLIDENNFKILKDGKIYFDEALKYKNTLYQKKVEKVKSIMKLGFQNELGTNFESHLLY